MYKKDFKFNELFGIQILISDTKIKIFIKSFLMYMESKIKRVRLLFRRPHVNQ